MEFSDSSKDLIFVHFKCEKCDKGNMIYHHETAVVEGVLYYRNRCNNCGHEMLSRSFYPTVKERADLGRVDKPGLLVQLCAKECEGVK